MKRIKCRSVIIKYIVNKIHINISYSVEDSVYVHVRSNVSDTSIRESVLDDIKNKL